MTDLLLDLADYFDRINYKGAIDVTEETLKELHISHTLNIPFENLDVYYKRPVSLDVASLFSKLVINKRGGYCFEMNGLFSHVLQQTGFKVTNLLARGTVDGIQFHAKTHQVMLVECEDKRWLADVGFGNEGIIAPLLLQEYLDQKQFTHTYRLVKDPKFGYILQKKRGSEYHPLYAFTLAECCPMDFIMSHHFTSTFPDSFFTKIKMVTMPTKEGRITLTDNQFKHVKNGNVSEKAINNDSEFNTILKKYFNLDLELIKVR